MRKRSLFFGVFFVLLALAFNVLAFQLNRENQKQEPPPVQIVEFQDSQSKPIVGSVRHLHFDEGEVPIYVYKPLL